MDAGARAVALADRVHARRGRAWILEGSVGMGVGSLAADVAADLGRRDLDVLAASALPALREVPRDDRDLRLGRIDVYVTAIRAARKTRWRAATSDRARDLRIERLMRPAGRGEDIRLRGDTRADPLTDRRCSPLHDG